MTRVVFAAIATTGPVPGEHHTWEIGLVERRVDGSQHEHHLFAPPKLSNADPGYLVDHRFYERTYGWKVPLSPALRAPTAPTPGPTWDDRATVAAKVARTTSGAVLVGHDVATVAAFLEYYLRTCANAPAWERQLVDVDVLAAGYEAGRGYPALTDAAETCTALQVALESARVYDAVYGAPWGER